MFNRSTDHPVEFEDENTFLGGVQMGECHIIVKYYLYLALTTPASRHLAEGIASSRLNWLT